MISKTDWIVPDVNCAEFALYWKKLQPMNLEFVEYLWFAKYIFDFSPKYSFPSIKINFVRYHGISKILNGGKINGEM